MIVMRILAVASIAGCAAIAFAPRGAADPARESFSIGFRYDADKPALDNYLSFARQAERACSMQHVHRLNLREVDRACVEGLLDQVVTRMARTQLAEVHEARTGRRDDSSRSLAAR